jgi:hypothetical protein
MPVVTLRGLDSWSVCINYVHGRQDTGSRQIDYVASKADRRR